MHESELIQLIQYSFLLILFLFLSAFFSGSETAFFSLNSLEREKLRSVSGKVKKRFIDLFFLSPDRVLITILTGNMIVNVFATDLFTSTISEILGTKISGIDPELVSILFMTPLVLLFGEMIPKNVVVRHPLYFSKLSLIPLYFFNLVFTPITGILNKLRHKLLKRITENNIKDESYNHSLISSAMKVGFKRGIINKYELDLLESYLEFRNKIAEDVMIPRTEILGVEVYKDIDEIFHMITENDRYLKSPYMYVYEKDFDHLLGYIDIKDFLPYKYGLKKKQPLKDHVKPFYSIPKSKKLKDLLVELRKENTEAALAIDEYGGTAGIVTFQIIIQDILDYFYSSEEDSIIKISDNRFSLPATVEIERLEDIFGVTFHTKSRTVSGLIIENLGEIPEKGRVVNISGLRFKVLKVDKTRILHVEVEREQ